jgi:tRNA(adenine34) deaminase
MDADLGFMRQALAQAGLAAAAGEVPVGAVVVQGGRVIGQGHNLTVGRQDISAHAEILALRQASQALGNHRLDGCTLYVTLEPCLMCSGAILGARLARVVYGAPEPKTGAAGSVLDVFAHAALNHHTQIEGGVLAQECSAVLQGFFQERRQDQQAERGKNFLREDALRAPESSWPQRPEGLRSVYLNDLPALQDHRLHVLTAGQGASLAVLALHGPGQWSAVYASAGQALAQAGIGLAAPDLVGFGLSDKPKKPAWHTLARHAQVLQALMDALPQSQLLLVAPESMQALAARLATHAKVMGRWSLAEGVMPQSLADAPYPDAGHRVGPRCLPGLLSQAGTATQAQTLPADWVRALIAMGYSQR